MWQNGQRLSHYTNKLAKIVHRDQPRLGCIPKHLLMAKANCFPGALAPVLEITTRLRVTKLCKRCNLNGTAAAKRRPKLMVSSNDGFKGNTTMECHRQKPVCHARHHHSQLMAATAPKENIWYNSEDDYESNELCEICLESEEIASNIKLVATSLIYLETQLICFLLYL